MLLGDSVQESCWDRAERGHREERSQGPEPKAALAPENLTIGHQVLVNVAPKICRRLSSMTKDTEVPPWKGRLWHSHNQTQVSPAPGLCLPWVALSTLLGWMSPCDTGAG